MLISGDLTEAVSAQEKAQGAGDVEGTDSEPTGDGTHLPSEASADTNVPSERESDAAAEQDQLIAADPEVIENARKHFHQGVAFARAGNCDAAIAEFLAAYRLIPRPNALYNIGQCQERLFRYDLAIEYYKRYLQEAAEDAPDRPAVMGALGTLRNLLGVLHIQSNVGAEVWVDDRMMGYAPGDVFVPAGRHIVELRSEKYLSKRTEIQIVGREDIDIALELSKARTTVRVTETTGLSPTLFWIGTSATLVTAIIGGAVGVHVLSLRDQAESIDSLHPDRDQAQKDVQTAELTADIFFAAASVLAIGTTIVAFITQWDKEGRQPHPDLQKRTEQKSISIAPQLGVRYTGLGLKGTL